MSKLKIILTLVAMFGLALVINLGTALAQDEPVTAAEEIFTQELEAPVVESEAAAEDNALSAEVLDRQVKGERSGQNDISKCKIIFLISNSPNS